CALGDWRRTNAPGTTVAHGECGASRNRGRAGPLLRLVGKQFLVDVPAASTCTHGVACGARCRNPSLYRRPLARNGHLVRPRTCAADNAGRSEPRVKGDRTWTYGRQVTFRSDQRLSGDTGRAFVTPGYRRRPFCWHAQ